MLKNVLFGVFLLVFLPSAFVFSSQEKENRFILPEYSKKVTLDFKNADLKDVLKAFSKQIGSNFVINEDIPEKKVTVFLENVPVEEALEKLLSINGLGYDFDSSMNLFIVKVKPLSDDEKMITRVFHLRYASVDSSLLKSASAASTGGVSSSGGSSSGGGFSAALKSVLTAKGSVVDDTRTNSIVVTDVHSNFPEIERLMAKLDLPLKQVVIQVEMLDASKSSVDTMGAKFNLSANFSSGSITGFFPFDKNNIMNKYTGSGLAFTPGLIDFSATTLALDFLKSQTDTKSLARPRIVTNDNETAIIQITSNEAIGVVETTSTGTTSTTAAQPERSSTGVWLTVTPQVNDVTNEITMVVIPKVVDATSSSSFRTSNGKIATFLNPEERSVKISLRVANGKTMIIGGLLRHDKTEAHNDLPFLSKIPFFGAAFRHKDLKGNERELIIFLTPYVLDSDQVVSEVLEKETSRQQQFREQSFPDVRTGVVDMEMDKINSAHRNF